MHSTRMRLIPHSAIRIQTRGSHDLAGMTETTQYLSFKLEEEFYALDISAFPLLLQGFDVLSSSNPDIFPLSWVS